MSVCIAHRIYRGPDADKVIVLEEKLQNYTGNINNVIVVRFLGT